MSVGYGGESDRSVDDGIGCEKSAMWWMMVRCDARCRRRGCSKRKVLPNFLAGEEEQPLEG